MAFKLGMNVDLCVGYIMVILMTLTFMQGYSGSTVGKKNQL